MGVNDITLAGGMRTNLLQLQSVNTLMSRTSNRLATGQRVNSPTDDAAAYFAAQGYRSRASDLAVRKDSMGEAIQTISAANEGVKAITSLIEQAKGLAASARSANVADRAKLATQFDALRGQIDQLAADASYKGTDLINSATATLKVDFNEGGTSQLTVTGFDATSTGLGIVAAAGSWATDANIDAAVTNLDTALTTLRTSAANLGSNSSVIVARQDFTANMINVLTGGADALTVADPNEEGANMLALQTRQQLGIVALSMSAQSQQSILKLF
jgi:flagellin-like hook-associated protein FlgL